MICYRHCWW